MRRIAPGVLPPPLPTKVNWGIKLKFMILFFIRGWFFFCALFYFFLIYIVPYRIYLPFVYRFSKGPPSFFSSIICCYHTYFFCSISNPITFVLTSFFLFSFSSSNLSNISISNIPPPPHPLFLFLFYYASFFLLIQCFFFWKLGQKNT